MHGKAIVPLKLWSEDQIVAAAQAGEDPAVEYLTTEYPPMRSLIASLRRSVDPRNVAPAEIEAAARLAILEALQGFDSERGVRFGTYAYHFIRGAMLKALYPHVERRRDPEDESDRIRLVPLNGPSEEDSASDGYESEMRRQDPAYGIDPGYADVEDAPRDAAVRAFVRSLPENQRTITEDVFWNERTHGEVATERGVSRPAVSRTLKRVYARGQKELAISPGRCCLGVTKTSACTITEMINTDQAAARAARRDTA